MQALTAFRFHTGSIKRMKEVDTETAQQLCFDSILVRLKVAHQDLPGADRVLFRFHTGSIKRTKTRRPDRSETRFDSILVRLKVDLWMIVPIFVVKVSIPYWFD